MKEIQLSKSSQILLNSFGLISFKIFVALILTIIFLLIIADRDFSNILYLRDYWLIISLILGFIISFVSIPIIEKWYKKKTGFQRLKHKNNLTSVKKVIDKRLSDLSNRAKQIDIEQIRR